MVKVLNSRLLARASVVAIALASSPLAAQQQGDVSTQSAEDAPADDGAIIVTGSRISRPNFDTVEPSVVLSSDQIEKRGFETLGQALNELPAFGVPGNSPVGAQSSFGPGLRELSWSGL